MLLKLLTNKIDISKCIHTKKYSLSMYLVSPPAYDQSLGKHLR